MAKRQTGLKLNIVTNGRSVNIGNNSGCEKDMYNKSCIMTFLAVDIICLIFQKAVKINK